MATQRHDQETARVGEDVTLSFSVTDDAGTAVTVSSGVTGVYTLARRRGDESILSITGDISYTGSTASVSFNTADIVIGDDEVQGLGDFFDQLRLTKSGDTLYVSEGIFTVLPVNA